MYYPGPDRYQGYERRPPARAYSESPPYGYAGHYPGPPPPPMMHGYYSHAQFHSSYQMHAIETVDQGEELLERLEQSGRVPSKDKFRRMACMTFVSTGVCPYGDRCVFLHDFRIKAEQAKVKTTRQSKADNTIKDTFYWPDMTRRDICRYLDAQGLPDCNQRYVIPESFSSLMSSFHNRGIYSIWNHFAEFCAHNSRLQEEQRPIERDPFFQVSNYLGNRHVFGTYRLKIFVHLSTVPEAAPNTGKLELSFVSGVTTASGGSGTPDRPPVASPLAPAETTALTISQLLASPGTPLLGYNTHVPDSPAMPQRNPVIPPAPSAHTVTPTASVTTPLAAYRPQLSHISPIRTPSMFTPRADASPFRPAAQPVAKPKGGDRVGSDDDDWILRALEPVPVPMEKKKTHARAAAAAVEREPEADEPLDSIVLANTQLNYLLSRTLSPIPAVESRPMFTSPKGKSVVWADTQKAKLERWEGESTSTLSEGSGADDLDCWAAMDALELTSLSEEADIPSGAVDSPPRPEVWGRLEELQRQTSEGIFGQAGEAGCAAAVEKGADLDEREGVRLTALSDDEWLSRQMAHTVGVEQAQLPTVSQRGDGDFLGWSADATAAGRFFWAGSNSALEGLDLGLTGQDSGGWGSSGGDRKEGGGVGPWEVPKDDNQAATDDAIGRLCNDLG